MFPSRKNMVQVLTKEFPEIKTIIQTINGRDTSVIIENKGKVLYGDGTITDVLNGMKVTISETTFYQIHSQQCEVLYDLARRKLHLNKNDKVLDTYCGVGTIGMYMAKDCKQVTGVEVNPDSVKNAIYNAKQNNLKNIRFVQADSTKFMQEAARHHQYYDAIILDPPRAGTTKEFIEKACALQPKKILYISCDPKTLVRDLSQFRRQGYTSKKVDVVDMFPHTEHVETVVL